MLQGDDIHGKNNYYNAPNPPVLSAGDFTWPCISSTISYIFALTKFVVIAL